MPNEKKLKNWSVHATVIGSQWLGIFKAKTAKEAVALALSEASVNLCHQCSGQCEDAEVTEAEAVLEEDE